MIQKINKEEKEFPMPKKCGVAVQIGKEWHACHFPAGHDGLHGCSHYGWDNKEEMYEHPMIGAARARFPEAPTPTPTVPPK